MRTIDTVAGEEFQFFDNDVDSDLVLLSAVGFVLSF